ncbi:MAG: methylenetetrahydrofolate reductase [NAD(P)H] [Alphaproteobacteria bacterium]|nr:methylenetetrahydrofolate reductase [NAD(P)H] [Alphaproteobacteria bacterium]
MTPLVSFEFFPPKTEAMEQSLWQAIQRLAPLNPRFVSVTYGAGGTTRQRTHATVRRILDETGLTPAAHLTCVGASRAEVDEIARTYSHLGVKYLVALRGDIPAEGVGVHPEGYRYASELVEGLRKVDDFDLSVAAYPEVHPEAASAQDDLDALKRKIDAGATRAITNFFFDADVYLRFVDRARRAGINVPIVPGIMPVSNFAQMVKFAAANGIAVPAKFAERFAGLDDDPETRRLVAITTAAELCQKLRFNGVSEFHFYTLNRAEMTYALCHLLDVRPQPAGQAA